MEKTNFISGIILFIFGTAVFIGSMNYPFGTIYSPGAGFIPRITSFILIVISTFIITSSYIKSRRGNIAKKVFFSTKDGPKRILLASASLISYRFLFTILGFIPTNFFFFLFVTRVLGYFSWRTCLVFSTISTIIAYYLFHVLLEIQMPVGIFKI